MTVSLRGREAFIFFPGNWIRDFDFDFDCDVNVDLANDVDGDVGVDAAGAGEEALIDSPQAYEMAV